MGQPGSCNQPLINKEASVSWYFDKLVIMMMMMNDDDDDDYNKEEEEEKNIFCIISVQGDVNFQKREMPSPNVRL